MRGLTESRPISFSWRWHATDASWCAEGRMVEEFVMEQLVPPYLLELAVGEIGWWESG